MASAIAFLAFIEAIFDQLSADKKSGRDTRAKDDWL
jgi:hypothetical protein